MTNSPNPRVLAPTVLYVQPADLAKQLAFRDADDPRLQACCESATEGIDSWVGNITAQFVEPIPATIARVALSYAVDIWKQPDATFGVMGLSETGAVRAPRDLLARHEAELLPYLNPDTGWGIG